MIRGIIWYYYAVAGLFLFSLTFSMGSVAYKKYLGEEEYSNLAEESNIRYINLLGTFGLFASPGLALWPVYYLTWHGVSIYQTIAELIYSLNEDGD